MTKTKADRKAQHQAHEAEVTERRRKVSALHLARMGPVEIARRLGLSQATVSRDIAALTSDRLAIVTDIREARARELAELDDMEREVAMQYAECKALKLSEVPKLDLKDRVAAITYLDGKSIKLLDLRLSIKDRRAKLLGLYAPTKTAHEGRLTLDLVNSLTDEQVDAELRLRGIEP